MGCRSTAVGPVADKGLLAVDHRAIGGAAGGRAHRLEIRARAGLGHRHRADQRAGRHPGQPAMALRFGAIGEDIMGDDPRAHAVAGAETAPEAGAHDFLRDDRLMRERAAAAAIFSGDARAELPRRPGAAPGVAIDDAPRTEEYTSA